MLPCILRDRRENAYLHSEGPDTAIRVNLAKEKGKSKESHDVGKAGDLLVTCTSSTRLRSRGISRCPFSPGLFRQNEGQIRAPSRRCGPPL